MDLNHLLTWIVFISCISLVIKGIRNSAVFTSGWFLVAAFVFVVTAVLLYFTPTIAGLVGGSLWALLIVVPSIAIINTNQLVTQQKFKQARIMSIIVRLLHPADGWREQPQLIKALSMVQEGLIDEATLIFQRYQSSATLTGRYAAITLYQMNSRWYELLVWMQINIQSEVLSKDSYVLLTYLRSLGETGDVNGLLQAWQQFQLSIEKTNLETRSYARMLVLSFCGQKEQVAKLFDNLLFMYPQIIKIFWLATAEQATGSLEIARSELLSISETKDIRIRQAIEWRLTKPCILASSELTRSSQHVLDQIITDMEQEAWYGGRSESQRRRPNATFLIIGLNLVAFALEIKFGGSTSVYALYKLGALVPKQVLAGDWWRLFTATFLHFGWLHLLMNMFGVYLFGRLVELILGVPQYLFVYLMTGLGSMLTVTIMSVLGYSQATFIVGASGCLMGLIGVLIAIFLRDWLRHKVKIASKNLRQFLFIILLQTVFDLTTPGISFIGHISGTIIGFLLGMIVKYDGKAK